MNMMESTPANNMCVEAYLCCLFKAVSHSFAVNTLMENTQTRWNIRSALFVVRSRVWSLVFFCDLNSARTNARIMQDKNILGGGDQS